MGCAAKRIIQLRVISRKLPLKTAWSPRKSAENRIGIKFLEDLFKPELVINFYGAIKLIIF
jgi:hypothetical protein